MAVAVLSFAAARRRLRYRRLHPRPSVVRHSARFQKFLREAHDRVLRVITELVINHTSDQHPWFQRARRAEPGSRGTRLLRLERHAGTYGDARIIFKDFEHSNWSWDPLAKAYYWHRFYAHQPDLNFDNPPCSEWSSRRWILAADGGRRASGSTRFPIFTSGKGPTARICPRRTRFSKSFATTSTSRSPAGCCWPRPINGPRTPIAYFGDGDECHTAFHFPVMPRLFMAIHMEDRFPIVDILQQTPPIPPDCQWLIFLRNHDELTLEMVTDEERDYMYRVYAHDRAGPHQSRHPPPAGSAAGQQPPQDRADERAVVLAARHAGRLLWRRDRHGRQYLPGRSQRRPHADAVDAPTATPAFPTPIRSSCFLPLILDPEYRYETVNVETQQKNPMSLLWWMKRLIALRQHYAALRRGDLELLAPENNKVLAFTRQLDGECVLAVANLSRFVQYVELDLGRFVGRHPVEMFGQSRFPVIGKALYPLTLAPHTFFWFSIEVEATPGAGTTPELPPAKLAFPAGWTSLTTGRPKRTLESVLLGSLPARLGPRGQSLRSAQVFDVITLDREAHAPCLVLVRLEYLEGEPDGYLLPLARRGGPRRRTARHRAPGDADRPAARRVRARRWSSTRRPTRPRPRCFWKPSSTGGRSRGCTPR